MKKMITLIMASALFLPQLFLYADESHHPEQQGPEEETQTQGKPARGGMMGKMEAHMEKMMRQMEEIQKTDDPAKREKLLQEHMSTMREGMEMMRSMGKGMMGGGEHCEMEGMMKEMMSGNGDHCRMKGMMGGDGCRMMKEMMGGGGDHCKMKGIMGGDGCCMKQGMMGGGGDHCKMKGMMGGDGCCMKQGMMGGGGDHCKMKEMMGGGMHRKSEKAGCDNREAHRRMEKRMDMMQMMMEQMMRNQKGQGKEGAVPES